MHVADPPRVSSSGMAEGPPLPPGYREAWESQLRLIRPSDPSVRVEEYRIEEGDPADAILRVAGEAASDLIVLGTRRKAGLAGMLSQAGLADGSMCSAAPTAASEESGGGVMVRQFTFDLREAGRP